MSGEVRKLRDCSWAPGSAAVSPEDVLMLLSCCEDVKALNFEDLPR
jgi:hypothetical protein